MNPSLKEDQEGWCLLKLGCRGPVTHNACPTLRWNQGTSYSIVSGHPCLGCSAPGFWDAGGFYRELRPETTPVDEESATPQEHSGTLFDDHCVYCHLPSRRTFRAPPEKIPAFLGSSGVRAHRFDFTEAQLEDLAAYLKTLGSTE